MSLVDIIAKRGSIGDGIAPAVGNRLLSLLPPEDAHWISGEVERISAKNGLVLAESGEKFDYVYFPESCVISMVNPTSDGIVEVGTVGNEGMAGLSVFLD